MSKSEFKFKRMEITSRIKEILKNHSQDDAIIKLNGFMRQNYWNNELRISIGKLYLIKSDFINAGKYLFFIDNPNEAEQRAINRYKESKKGNKYEIFKDLVLKSNSIKGIDKTTSLKIFNLIHNISEQDGNISKEIVLWICSYVSKINNEITKLKHCEKHT